MQRQVVRAAGFGVGAGEAEAAEGLDAHQSPGDAAVEVDVARFELVTGAFKVVAILGIHAAGEAVGIVVRYRQGLVEVAGRYHGEDGAEDLLLRYPRLGVHVAVAGRGDEVAIRGIAGVLDRKSTR